MTIRTIPKYTLYHSCGCGCHQCTLCLLIPQKWDIDQKKENSNHQPLKWWLCVNTPWITGLLRWSNEIATLWEEPGSIEITVVMADVGSDHNRNYSEKMPEWFLVIDIRGKPWHWDSSSDQLPQRHSHNNNNKHHSQCNWQCWSPSQGIWKLPDASH